MNALAILSVADLCSYKEMNIHIVYITECLLNIIN